MVAEQGVQMFIKVLKASLTVGLFIGMAVAVMILVHAFDNKQPKSESLISFHQECQIGCEDINSTYSDSLEEVASVQDRIHQDNLDKKKKAIKLDEEARIKREEAERKRLAELEKERERRRVERLKQQEERERQNQLAIERKQEQSAQSQQNESHVVSRSSDYASDWKTFEATAYTAYCYKCSGITRTGVNLKNSIYHNGRRVIAVDPNRIPLGSNVQIMLSDGTVIEATAQDTGGRILGGVIDISHESKQQAKSFGRQQVKLRIVK